MDSIDCNNISIDHTIDTICTTSTRISTRSLMEGAMELITSPKSSSNSNSNSNTENDEDATIIAQEEEEQAAAVVKKEPSPMTPDSDLSRLDRKIWVVTTAALPWRTGTSVNPLARALYLTRGRPKHSVTLMVPFLPSKEEQAQVYKDKCFETEEEQEEWIRTYCIERVNCKEEAENLRIRFYHSTYNHSFGSIFATVDVCALIPNDEADVCILEEPEHMNWMRVVDEPPSPKPTNDNNTNDTPPSSSPSENENTDTGTTTSTTTTTITTTSESSMTTPEQEDLNRDHEIWIAHLGWAVKFKHVVGIIHTNYDAYVRNYGMGTAFLAASALHALSALVTRAYCHRVIRLSDTLPSLDKTKEVTCNVHGVRSEFLEPAQPSEENNDTSLASVYFIGKLIWAKGFEKLLDIQELYKKETGEYFTIDVYGSGPDERAIQRAFFGRKGILDTSPKEHHARESTPDRTAAGFFQKTENLREQLFGKLSSAPTSPTTTNNNNESAAGAIPVTPSSPKTPTPEPEVPHQPIEVVWDGPVIVSPKEATTTLSETEFPNPFVILSDLSGEFMETSVTTTKAGAKVGQDIVQLGVHAFASEGSSASSAASSSNNEDNASTSSSSSSQGESSPQAAEGSTPKSEHENKSKKEKHRRKLRFDPPKSRYELRRYPIPGRFLGMKDHAVVRDLTRHKIFFNPSESEVLCTTSAEALAMGKFVILPKHPSNTFFLQFSNCLAYESKQDCVQKMKWALENDPKPLSEEEHFHLTWEGATERLYKFSSMTEAEVADWKESGREQSDRDAAKLHYETVKRGRGVQKLLHR